MTTKSKGITKDKLKKHYPNLATILDEIQDKDPKKNYWFFVNYSGKYADRNGKSRSVSLGSVIDLISDNGYKVEILATKKRNFAKNI